MLKYLDSQGVKQNLPPSSGRPKKVHRYENSIYLYMRTLISSEALYRNRVSIIRRCAVVRRVLILRKPYFLEKRYLDQLPFYALPLVRQQMGSEHVMAIFCDGIRCICFQGR